MQSREERISILSELIEMAKSDDVLKKTEYDFILDVSKELNLDMETVENLIKNTTAKNFKRTLKDSIYQLHRLIVMMNIDSHQHHLEVERLQVIGLRMGLKPSVILKVIEEVNKYPGKVVSAETLFSFTK